MRTWITCLCLALGALALGSPAHALPGISDLGAVYDGNSHGTRGLSGENVPIGFTFDEIEPNGDFTGTFSFGPMTGRVTSTGKVTFTATVNNFQFKGSGLLSATGRFLTGTFTLKNGSITDIASFEVERQDQSAAAVSADGLHRYLAGLGGSPPAALAGPADLAGFYNGRRHSRVNAVGEDMGLTMNFAIQSNGKFTGLIGSVPIAGKVSSRGVVKFSGQFTSPQGDRFKIKGSAQLSSTGRFLTGIFNQKIRTADGKTGSGDSTFDMERGR